MNLVSVQVQVKLFFPARVSWAGPGNKIILKTEADYLLNSIEEVATFENIIYLNFNKNLSFQDYITYKSLLLHLDRNNVNLSNDEFIYN